LTGSEGPQRDDAGPQPRAATLSAGRVGRAHGLDGSFYVTRPVARLLAPGAVLTVGGRRAGVVRRAGTDARPIVRLEGVEGREAAEQLRGLELSVDSAEAPQLQEGEWWAHELEGCEVVGAGSVLGTVARLLELPSCEALEVRLAGGEELLVPMVKDALLSVDVRGRRIEVNPGFLDLDPAFPDRDAPGAERPGG
jgi:16S rRNA processing protein RimM